jgi:hypothetical protein
MYTQLEQANNNLEKRKAVASSTKSVRELQAWQSQRVSGAQQYGEGFLYVPSESYEQLDVLLMPKAGMLPSRASPFLIISRKRI